MSKTPNKTAAAPAAGKEGEKPAKAPKEVKALATVNAKALSVDVGPAVLANLVKAHDEEDKGRSLLAASEKKRYDAISSVTIAIMKAANADDGIDLGASFKADRKANSLLNDQIFIALGLMEKKTVGDKETLVYTKAAAKFFPAKDDDPKAEATKRKSQLRNNFIQIVKRGAQAAEGMIQKDISAKMDAKEGTLRISGPSVLKEFGMSEVLLNEKQTIKGAGKDGGDVLLTAKPSFTAVAALGAAEHGATVQRGNTSRSRGTIQTNPDAAIEAVADSVVKLCEKMDAKNLTEKQTAALKKIQNAVDKVLA